MFTLTDSQWCAVLAARGKCGAINSTLHNWVYGLFTLRKRGVRLKRESRKSWCG